MTDTITEERTAPRVHPARRLGQILQGLALGAGLPFAIFELIRIAGDITPFKYQGF